MFAVVVYNDQKLLPLIDIYFAFFCQLIDFVLLMRMFVSSSSLQRKKINLLFISVKCVFFSHFNGWICRHHATNYILIVIVVFILVPCNNDYILMSIIDIWWRKMNGKCHEKFVGTKFWLIFFKQFITWCVSVFMVNVVKTSKWRLKPSSPLMS